VKIETGREGKKYRSLEAVRKRKKKKREKQTVRRKNRE